MARMGSYCKAYYVRDLAAFDGWRPDLTQLRPAVADLDDREVHVQRASLGDDDIVYLQEDLSVTEGIFLDEHVLFSDSGPEWRAFCTQTLGFDPAGELEPAGHAEPRPAAD